MTVSLHKKDSGVARFASLELLGAEQPRCEPEPDPRDEEISRLAAERDSLKARLADAERRAGTERAAIVAEARRCAAEELEQDDRRRLELLDEGLRQALARFEAGLLSQCRQLAPRLAHEALKRLVEVRADEADWLSRAIERRLQSLGSRAVVSLRIAAKDCSDEMTGRLAARLAPGVEAKSDPTLAPGTALVCLRLGEVLVDPATGAERLLALLDEVGTADV